MDKNLSAPGLAGGTTGRWAAALVLALVLASWGASAQNPDPETVVPNAAGVYLDRVAPVAGKVSGPAGVNAVPIPLTYTGAGDGDGSGLKWVTLWMKIGANGAWSETPVRGTEPSGSFAFEELNADGSYSFALRAEDQAGNLSPKPQGAGDVTVVLDRRPPVITLKGASTIWLAVGEAYTDAGATATDNVDGDLSASIVVDNPVNTAQRGTYTVTYSVSDKAGNAATPARRTVKVGDGFALTVTPPAHGAIEANPGPSTNGLYAPGAEVTLRYVADPMAGYDAASWVGATSDIVGSGLARVVMDGDKTVSVTLARQTGAVAVNVTPDDAQWTVTDGDGAAHPGTGDATLPAVPAGAVSIAYTPREGYETTPAAQQAILLKGGTVSFQGIYASENQATVALPKGLEAAPGDTVDCPVQISASQALTGFRLELKVDPAVAQVVGAVNGGLTSGWAAVAVEKTSGGAVLTGAGADTPAGGGTLVVLRLQVAAEAADGAVTPLQAASVTINGGAIPAQAEDGQLIVHVQRFAWGDANGDGRAGDSDASLLLQYRVGLVDRLAEPEAADVSGEQPPVVGTLDAALVLQRSARVIGQFPADTDGDGFGPEAVPAAATPAPAGAPRAVRFTETVNAERGVEFGFPIAMDDASGVLGYWLQVAYDPETVEFLSAGRGSLTQTFTVPVVNVTPGVVTIAAAGAEAASGAGSLASLNFRTRPGVESGTAQFQLVAIELNDGTIACTGDSAGAQPVLESVSPARGAETGGSVVTLKGANLAQVTEVRFGGQPAPWFEVHRNTGLLKAVAPAGSGTVDIEAVSAEGSATLPGAFSYFRPDVFLALEPQASVPAGGLVHVPVWLSATEKGQVASIRFELRFDPTLFAVQSGKALTLASPGDSATASGKQVAATLVGPGRLAVTITGTPDTALQPGLLCTCHVLALGDTADTTGLFYVSDISASNSQNRTLPSASGAKLR